MAIPYATNPYPHYVPADPSPTPENNLQVVGLCKKRGMTNSCRGGYSPPPGCTRETGTIWQWRSYSRTEHYVGQKYVILGRFALCFQWKVWSTVVRTMACFHVWFSEVFLRSSTQKLGFWAPSLKLPYGHENGSICPSGAFGSASISEFNGAAVERKLP